MLRLAAGVIRFQNDVYPKKKDLFEDLSKGQEPEALFIACSDSRVEIAMITQTEPGDLFVVRNAGNIVPPHTDHTGGVIASIEFAVAALEVPHVVICGHTDCGAMKGAMNPEAVDALPRVKEWLGFSKAAVETTNVLGKGLSDDERLLMLLEQNVVLQLRHLKTHPTVARRLAAGDLEVHGWLYDIRTGDVHAYDEAQGKFVTVDVRYAART